MQFSSKGWENLLFVFGSKRVKLSPQRSGDVILENVTEDGRELAGSAGRLVNPGHAIEAGWFLLQHARRRRNDALARVAVDKFIVGAFEYGWDGTDGGLFYFLDADGFSPTQLEWNMKLFWPHSEALIAFLMAYGETKDDALLQAFDKVFQYTFSHVSAICKSLTQYCGDLWLIPRLSV